MSSEPFVRVRGLGKAFSLYATPWHRLGNLAFGIGRGGETWAVRDVSLDLRKGDCIGIVGRNGAGKSTLLEMICGITQPSTGTIETRGRIAALLQLGAGFNPEFTGRENARLGAALYGLAEVDIESRMEAVAAFAGIGEYFDRPVREYSSGMYARLAFSVCAHVDADILVVDEILGVGDVTFQQKAMRFLRRFRRSGIILFVSHNEHAVAALCNGAIWLDRGQTVASGEPRDVLYLYRRELERVAWRDDAFAVGDKADPADYGEDGQRGEPSPSMQAWPTELDLDDPAPLRGGVTIERVAVDAGDTPLSALEGGERITLSVTIHAMRSDARPFVLFALRNPLGQILFCGDGRAADPQAALEAGGSAVFRFTFDLPYLPTGTYPLEVFVFSAGATSGCEDHRETAATLKVLSSHVSHGLANMRTETSLEAFRAAR